ncbi:MAG: hypothetical protein RL033_5653 [Pseudomonadota bacterium]|jgi:hypothetical protein
MKAPGIRLALLGLSVLGCARSGGKGKAVEGPCSVRARVDHDVVFKKECSPYLQPPGGLDVIDGATLTIEAGVEIRFGDGDWLEVGAAGQPGRLIAKGTAEEPIVLTTSSPETPSTWLGVWFHSGTLSGSELSHAVIRRAGGQNNHSKPNLLMGCVTMTGVQEQVLRVSDVRVEGCEHGGFRITNSQPALGPLSVADAPDGLVLDAASVGSIPAGVVYERVARNVITGGALLETARWLPQPVPFVVTGDIEVGGVAGPLLLLAPGLTLEFDYGKGLSIASTEPGTLLALGVAGNPVVLSAHDADRPWRGLSFGERAGVTSRVEYTEIRRTGQGPAVRMCSPPERVAMSHVRFAETEVDVERCP